MTLQITVTPVGKRNTVSLQCSCSWRPVEAIATGLRCPECGATFTAAEASHAAMIAIAEITVAYEAAIADIPTADA